jgi:hypothetical protein
MCSIRRFWTNLSLPFHYDSQKRGSNRSTYSKSGPQETTCHPARCLCWTLKLFRVRKTVRSGCLRLVVSFNFPSVRCNRAHHRLGFDSYLSRHILDPPRHLLALNSSESARSCEGNATVQLSCRLSSRFRLPSKTFTLNRGTASGSSFLWH